jgi:hypothetical protein
VDHDQVTDPQVRVAGASSQPQQPLPPPPTQYNPPCFHVAFLSFQLQLEWNATFTFTVRFARIYLVVVWTAASGVVEVARSGVDFAPHPATTTNATTASFTTPSAEEHPI